MIARHCLLTTHVFGVFTLALSASTVWGISITVQNPGFEDLTGLTPTNTASFTTENAHNLSAAGPGTYNGWSESQVDFSAFGANVTNIGIINVGGDITIETSNGGPGAFDGDEDENPDVTFPKMAVYLDAEGRVSQTTGHVISANDTSFTLSVDVGRTNTVNPFRGYDFSLYADDGATKTIIKTLQTSVDGGDPANNSWLVKTLVLTPADFAPYIGDLIGITLYRDVTLNGNEVWYDNISLEYTAVPEPCGFSLATVGVALLVARRRRIVG